MLTIVLEEKNETTVFAAEELKKYLSLLSKNSLDTVIGENIDNTNKIVLGLNAKPDTEIDTIDVDMVKLNGEIRGSNNRSILFGVYRFLEQLGIKWVRHGADGELIPNDSNYLEAEVHIHHTASNKVRCVCDEGAVSLENMLDNIDWAAKMGINAYFIQFIQSELFYRRWYEHDNNQHLKPEELSHEQYQAFKQKLIKEIKKRGLSYYGVGHGWIPLAYNLPEKSMEKGEIKLYLDDELIKNFALLDGKRSCEYEGESTLHMQLCYSNKNVLKRLVKTSANYFEEHPELDVVNYVLADGMNKMCECDECKKLRPSDFYIKIMNELDAELTKRNISTKIMFAVYCDMMWPPISEKINNPDRFILEFAPYSRRYGATLGELDAIENVKVPEFKYNKNKLFMQPTQLLEFYKQWQRYGAAKVNILFDYHFYVDLYNDLGGVEMARIIYEDIHAFKKLDLSGLGNCQTPRSFLPIGLGQWVMAKTLWDSSVTLQELSDDYFESAFGTYADKVKGFLTKVSELRKNRNVEDFREIVRLNEAFIPILENIKADNLENCQVSSLEYLRIYCDFLSSLADTERSILERNEEETNKFWEKTKDYVTKNEMKMQSVFDVHNLIMLYNVRRLPLAKKELTEDVIMEEKLL